MDSSNRNRSSLRRARRTAPLSAESLEGRQLLSMGGIGLGMGRFGDGYGLPTPALMPGGSIPSDDGPQGAEAWISNGLDYAREGGLGWDMNLGQAAGSIQAATSTQAAATTSTTPAATATPTSGTTTAATTAGLPGFGGMGRFLGMGGFGPGSAPTAAASATTTTSTAAAPGGTPPATAVPVMPGGMGMGGFRGGMPGRFDGMGGFGQATPTAPGGATTAPTGATTAPTSPIVAALQQYQADSKTIHDKSQVTPALQSALTNDLQALAEEATTAPAPAKALALRSDLLTIAGTLPTSDQLATLQSDFTAALASEGVTDTAAIARTFTDLGALIAATNITPADVATLAADLKAAGQSTAAPLGPQLGVDLDVLGLALDAHAGSTTTSAAATTASPSPPTTAASS